MSLDELSIDIYDINEKHGFWNSGGLDDEVVGTKLALIHSEVTEVLEAVRKEQGSQAIVEEFADIVIRVLDLYRGMRELGMVSESLDDVLQLKVEKNKLRPYKHGRRF